MRKILIIVSTVLAIVFGFVLGINTDQLTANALFKSLTSTNLEYTIPLTVTMLADIGENEQQTVTIPLVLHHSLAVESPADNVLAIESASPAYGSQAESVDNIGIPYELTAPDTIEISWLVREFDEMAVLEGVVTNIDPDDERVIDSLIIAATFYDSDGNFLAVSDTQPVPYAEPALPTGEDITFQIFSYEDAPFADIGSYTIQAEVGFGEPERRRN